MFLSTTFGDTRPRIEQRGTHACRLRRIVPQARQQNPNFFPPDLRAGLKQRQEAKIQQRLSNKKQEWTEWEEQVEAEERARRAVQRRPPSIVSTTPAPPMLEYQDAYQSSEMQRQTEEQRLDDIQRQVAENIRRRRSRTDRWMPPKVTEQAAKTAAREARRKQAQLQLEREQADMVAASRFFQGRVRQKIGRFAELVETVQKEVEEQQTEDRRGVSERRVQGQKRVGLGRKSVDMDDYAYGDEYSRPGDFYLPVDVVRVVRSASDDDLPLNRYNSRARVDEGFDDDNDTFVVVDVPVESIEVMDVVGVEEKEESFDQGSSTKNDEGYIDW